MRIVLATTQVPFIHGGAEEMTASLRRALQSEGHEVEVAAIPFQWWPPERILNHMLACGLLDLTTSMGRNIDLLIGLKFPAYLIPHPAKRLWLIHEHRTAYRLWDHPLGDMAVHPFGAVVRESILNADKACFSEAAALFSISNTVSQRIDEEIGVRPGVIYQPPPDEDLFRCEADEGYFFFPSRICDYKRQSLAVEALAHCRSGCRVVFCGAPDSEQKLLELQTRAVELGVDSQVQWLGHVSKEERIKLYAESTGVIYPTLDEDYGYVTLEAMLSSKPVITCTDSGAPLEFVVQGQTGLVCDPSPPALADSMDRLWADRVLARQLGASGLEHYRSLGISWTNAVRTLLA